MADSYISPYSIDECKNVIERVGTPPTQFSLAVFFLGGTRGRLHPYLWYKFIDKNTCEITFKFSGVSRKKRQELADTYKNAFSAVIMKKEAKLSSYRDICQGKINLLADQQGTVITTEIRFFPDAFFLYLGIFVLCTALLSVLSGNDGALVVSTFFVIAYILGIFNLCLNFLVLKHQLQPRLNQIIVECKAIPLPPLIEPVV